MTKIRVFEAAETFTVTMKPGGVVRARACFSPPVFWAARVLLGE